MVTSCPAATGLYWLGRRCPSHRCLSGGGGRAQTGPGAGTYVQAGTRCPALCPWDLPHHSSDGDKCTGVPPASPCPVPPQPGFEEPCPEPGEPGPQQPRQGATCPGSPPGCCPGRVLHGSLLRGAASPVLSPPDQATLCKSKLIRLHGYRHRNTRCILSLSINALYHPIKLIKKQSSSSHQVPCLNIINFILWLMIVSADGEHAS